MNTATEILATIQSVDFEDLAVVVAHITDAYSVVAFDLDVMDTFGAGKIFPVATFTFDDALAYALAIAS